MNRHLLRSLLLGVAVLLRASGAPAASTAGASLSVLVDGFDRPEFSARGAFYVEAIRGRDFELRLTNPFAVRVAVALSVDGLNSIDARHTDARSARKWVIEPYGSIVVPGWQTSESAARRFVFTGEGSSYGAKLGHTEDLGVIEAVFFRERVAPLPVTPMDAPPVAQSNAPAAASPMGALNDSSSRRAASPSAEKSPAGLADELAATGMGNRLRHEVENVFLDLEPVPAARIRIRYEFHPELVALGVLPCEPPALGRREHASGFVGSYCQER